MGKVVLNVLQALGRISFRCQLDQELKKRWDLTNEESHRGQEIESSHGRSGCFSGANDRTNGQAGIEERTWLRHNQVGLQRLRLTLAKIDKGDDGSGDRIGVSQRSRITSFVLPSLEVHRFGWANA